MTTSRESSLLGALRLEPSALDVLHGMPLAIALDGDSADVRVGLADASALLRFGLKGPGAAGWLEQRGVELPVHANCYRRDAFGALTARLGQSEFLLEDAPGGARVLALRAEAVSAAGVYPVPRQDAAFVLFGPKAEQVLAQTTNFDFRDSCREAKAAVLTLMAGVSVLVLGYELSGVPRYRIWCDPTLGPYLCRTLLEIVHEQGGRATGLFIALGHAPEPTASPEATPTEGT